MTNIIKFPRKLANLEKEYEDFLDDLGGFVLNVKAMTGDTWTQLAARCNLSPATLQKLADREYTRGPILSTFYKVARVLDDRGVIKHSMYAKWRGFNRAQAKKLDKAIKVL